MPVDIQADAGIIEIAADKSGTMAMEHSLGPVVTVQGFESGPELTTEENWVAGLTHVAGANDAGTPSLALQGEESLEADMGHVAEQNGRSLDASQGGVATESGDGLTEARPQAMLGSCGTYDGRVRVQPQGFRVVLFA
nr:hypothetical protein [Halomonas sp. MCCC 1A13316]